MLVSFLRTLVTVAFVGCLTGSGWGMTDDEWERRNAGSSRLPVRADHYAEDICRIIAREARRRLLPPDFFARLIWRESLFGRAAVSPKGAQGIAQFMPGTARERGLADPFLPHEALQASAHLLSDLRDRLGNLGLAAAAYNAGLGAVAAWLAGSAKLPFETEEYVAFVTGRPAADWKVSTADYPIPAIGADGEFSSSCRRLASRKLNPEPAVTRGTWKPWGIVVAGNRSETIALRSFNEVQSQFPTLLAHQNPFVIKKLNPAMGRLRIAYVMIGADNRADAEKFCAKLRALGGACVVERN
jgi:Transglycosylase SLT domain